MNPLGAEVKAAAHLFRSLLLLPPCGRGFRRRSLLSLIGFDSMCQENAGAEECNKPSNQLKHRSRLYIGLLRSIEASRFRFNRRGKMVFCAAAQMRRSFLDHVTATTRILIATKEPVTVCGAREQRARTDLVDNVKNPQFDLHALFRLRNRCLMMYCQSSSWSGDYVRKSNSK